MAATYPSGTAPSYTTPWDTILCWVSFRYMGSLGVVFDSRWRYQ